MIYKSQDKKFERFHTFYCIIYNNDLKNNENKLYIFSLQKQKQVLFPEIIHLYIFYFNMYTVYDK